MIKVRRSRSSRICQGDILRDVEFIEYAVERAGKIEVSKVVFPLTIVLTQDCDLEQDYRFRRSPATTQDKWLISVLMAPVYNVEHVYDGAHLSELGIQMERINKNRSPGQYLRNNERPRYHYLEFPEAVPVVPSVVDFKHYFSVNGLYLRKLKLRNFVCTISDLFREDVSVRFASFLARIGLPELRSASKKSRSPGEAA
jgi:hypothetical protein